MTNCLTARALSSQRAVPSTSCLIACVVVDGSCGRGLRFGDRHPERAVRRQPRGMTSVPALTDSEMTAHKHHASPRLSACSGCCYWNSFTADPAHRARGHSSTQVLRGLVNMTLLDCSLGWLTLGTGKRARRSGGHLITSSIGHVLFVSLLSSCGEYVHRSRSQCKHK